MPETDKYFSLNETPSLDLTVICDRVTELNTHKFRPGTPETGFDGANSD
jgi:hypothetical protein